MTKDIDYESSTASHCWPRGEYISGCISMIRKFQVNLLAGALVNAHFLPSNQEPVRGLATPCWIVFFLSDFRPQVKGKLSQISLVEKFNVEKIS